MSAAPELVFYDGSCGFCHRTVRFLLRQDRDGGLFRFAPLGGETFAKELPAAKRPSLPDSVVVLTAEGGVLVRSEAMLHLLRRLPGAWPRLAVWLEPVPKGLRDLAYAAFARLRRIFAPRPENACPLVPVELRGRFLR